MSHERTVTYSCPRCGFVARQLSHYRNHIARKQICKPLIANVIPTILNANMSKLRTGEDAQGPPCAHNNVTINGHHNTSHITNNITHTHFHVYAFGKEDMSLLTPEVMDLMVSLAADNGPDAVARMVNLVHFDPKSPHNMNVYVPPNDHGLPAVVFNGQAWKAERNNCDAIRGMIRERASNLKEHVEDNPGRVSKRDTAAFERFYFGEQAPFMADDGLVQQVRKMAEDNSKVVAKCHPDAPRAAARGIPTPPIPSK